MKSTPSFWMTDRSLDPIRYGWRQDMLVCLLGAALLWWGRDGHFYPYFAACGLLTLRVWILARQRPLSLRPFLAGGLFLVMVCFFLAPDLSDDYHRYLWEGYVQNQGYSPFVHTPASLYDKLDHPSEGKINHDELPAIYPPLAQSFFRIAAWLDDSLFGWKLILLLGLAPLFFIGDGNRFVIWAACPVVLIEGVWNAHLDVLGLVPALLLVKAMNQSDPWRAGFWLGVLTALKIMPVIFFPFCFLHFSSKGRFRFTAAFLALPVLFYLPYLDQWPELFTSFINYSRNWSFNNPVFLGLHWLAPGFARPILAILFLGVFLGLLRVDRPIQWKLLCVWAAMTALSPTVYPWYLVWFLPLATREKEPMIHGAYLAAFLSYLVFIPFRDSGVWRERLWWLIPEWIALFYFLGKALNGGSGTRVMEKNVSE